MSSMRPFRMPLDHQTYGVPSLVTSPPAHATPPSEAPVEIGRWSWPSLAEFRPALARIGTYVPRQKKASRTLVFANRVISLRSPFTPSLAPSLTLPPPRPLSLGSNLLAVYRCQCLPFYVSSIDFHYSQEVAMLHHRVHFPQAHGSSARLGMEIAHTEIAVFCCSSRPVALANRRNGANY